MADLGYIVEWRIINAADYGMPQRRRRTYIVGYQQDSVIAHKIDTLADWVEFDGVMAKAFEFTAKSNTLSEFDIEGTIQEVSANFNKGKKVSPFGNAGVMMNRHVYSVDADPVYDGPRQTLGGNLVDENLVPEEFLSQMKICQNGNTRKVQRRLIVFLKKVMNMFSQRVVWHSLTISTNLHARL